MAFILALDQSTTSSRALVFDRRGRVVAQAQQEFPQHYPRPGWVEHDPEDLWKSTRRAAIAAVADANHTAGDFAAVGVTNQRETTLLGDRATGKRPRATETTALGAAYLAGLAVSYWKTRDEIASVWKASKVFRPRKRLTHMRQMKADWARAVERSKRWVG